MALSAALIARLHGCAVGTSVWTWRTLVAAAIGASPRQSTAEIGFLVAMLSPCRRRGAGGGPLLASGLGQGGFRAREGRQRAHRGHTEGDHTVNGPGCHIEPFPTISRSRVA